MAQINCNVSDDAAVSILGITQPTLKKQIPLNSDDDDDHDHLHHARLR
jgi:hypothetical protein